jgi:Na+/H+-dicarboxylate symporter
MGDKVSFETRAQSVIQAILLAILLGVGYTVIGLRDSAVRQEFQNIQFSKELSDLRMEIKVVAASLVAAQAATATAAAAAEGRKGSR